MNLVRAKLVRGESKHCLRHDWVSGFTDQHCPKFGVMKYYPMECSGIPPCHKLWSRRGAEVASGLLTPMPHTVQYQTLGMPGHWWPSCSQMSRWTFGKKLANEVASGSSVQIFFVLPLVLCWCQSFMFYHIFK